MRKAFLKSSLLPCYATPTEIEGKQIVRMTSGKHPINHNLLERNLTQGEKSKDRTDL